MKSISFPLVLLITLIAHSPVNGADSIVWESVPLRTAEQKAKGMKGGEMGQMAFTLTLCKQDPSLMAMGIDTAAIYISEDGGRNWQSRRAGIHSNGVQSVAFDPGNKRVLWAAGLRSHAKTERSFPPDEKYYDKKADGIYRSADLGKTWKLLHRAAFLRGQAQNEYFAFDLKNATADGAVIIFALTHDQGLLRSEDSGASWQKIGPKGIIGNAIKRDEDKGWLWLAADQGLWLSRDNAVTWCRIETPALPVKGLVVQAGKPENIYLALGKAGIWQSEDAGQNWQERNRGIWKQNKWSRLAMSPVNAKILYADATETGGSLPCYSHDGGLNWHPIESREAGFYGSSVYFAEGLVAHPTKAMTAFHLYPPRITHDGGKTWQLFGSGVSGSRLGGKSAIAFRPDDSEKMVFFHTDHGASLTEDGGDTWSCLPAARQKDIGAMTMPGGAYDPTPGSQTLISAVGGWSRQRLCITHDDGRNWQVLAGREDIYRFFAWHPQNAKVVYAGTKTGGLCSEDAGKTWRQIDEPLRQMFAGNGDILYSLRKTEQRRSQILRSMDRGKTWELLGQELPHLISNFAVCPKDPNRIYAATEHSGVLIYDGQSWTKRGVGDGLEKDFFGKMIFSTVAVDPRHPEVVYAGQNHSWRGLARGIFRSTDSGSSWKNISGNLGPDLNVWSIAVSPHDSTVWLGTDYGNWRLR
ncbi:MAG: hypothetical protein L3J39_00155 [Verrucomicrobiales bacterium]|nr:hypothetical protein [Verrucomicrobiales bacterium]